MKRFFKSFGYAFCGIISCLRCERNMRIHFCAAFYALMLLHIFGASAGERAAVFTVIGLVIALEAVNTAVESAVDLITDENNKLAKLAKDAAAGGVLAAAVCAVGVGFAVFGDIEKLKSTAVRFIDRPAALVLLIISAAAWTAFIFAPCKKKGNEKNE